MRRDTYEVVVVGGGLAGLAAATALTERGVRVTLLEAEHYLGGRAGAWPDRLRDGTEFQMERGFHAFFRQYYNLRSLIRRVDPALDGLTPLHDYPVLGPGGASESFASLPRRAPFNVMELVRRTRTLRVRDLPRVSVRHAMEMLAFDAEATYAAWDGVSAKDYLDGLRFPPEARRMLFDVFAHSFFNPEAEYSAAELLMQFHFYFFGNPDGLVFDVMRRPFSTALFDPLAARLRARGATIRTGCPVESVTRAPGQVRVQAGGETLHADGVVLALSVPALKRVVTSSGLGPPSFRESIERLEVTRPFAVWRLWLDRKASADRAPFVGTTGYGLLDNISLYERLEDESEAWSERNGGSVVELHAYAVPEPTPEETVRRELWEALARLYPELADARVLEDRFLFRQDCPAFAPGSHADRPEVRTSMPEVRLAGDFVKLGVPSALMERAVASGYSAADQLLARWGLESEPVRSVPPRGMAAPLGWARAPVWTSPFRRA